MANWKADAVKEADMDEQELNRIEARVLAVQPECELSAAMWAGVREDVLKQLTPLLPRR